MCVHIQKYKHSYIDIDIYKYKRNFPNVISDDFSKTPEFCPKSATTGPLWIRVVKSHLEKESFCKLVIHYPKTKALLKNGKHCEG